MSQMLDDRSAVVEDRVSVSICIPAHSRTDELRRCIRAAVGQHYSGSFEVVVSDDSGSLSSLVSEFKGVRYVYCPDGGMVSNWKHAVDNSRGIYVALVMDDDELDPMFLTSTVQVLEANRRVGIVFTNHWFANASERCLRSCDVAPGLQKGDFLTTVLQQRPIAISAALMRRAAWVGAQPLPDIMASDLVLHARIAQQGYEGFYVDAPLMTYHQHPGQASNELRMREHVASAWRIIAAETGSAVALTQSRRASWSAIAGNVRRGQHDEARTSLATADLRIWERLIAGSLLSLPRQTSGWAVGLARRVASVGGSGKRS